MSEIWLHNIDKAADKKIRKKQQHTTGSASPDEAYGERHRKY
jgi:hypothetical protein